jgi:hypothetical protein
MAFNPITEDAFTELTVLREKAEAVLRCIIEDPQCARHQTLTYIASDYLFAMGEMIRAMQESRLTAPPSPGRKISP